MQDNVLPPTRGPVSTNQKKSVDYDYWLNILSWQIEEAAFLLCNLDPDNAYKSTSTGYVMTGEVDKMLRRIKRAVYSEELKSVYDSQNHFRALDFVLWANKNNFSVPTELQLLLKKQSLPYNCTLDTPELKSIEVATQSPPKEKQKDHKKESIKKPWNKAARKKKTPLEIECEIIWRIYGKRGYKQNAALDAWVKNEKKFKLITEHMLEDKTIYPKIENRNGKRDFINAIKKKIQHS